MSISYIGAYTMAKRQNGVCQGSLQKTIIFGHGVIVSTYSLLVGVQLICYENTTAMLNGDHPIAQYSLVGASAVSNESTSFRAVTDRGTHLLCSVPTKGCRDVWLSALNAGVEYRLMQQQEDGPTMQRKTKSYKIFPQIRPKYPRGLRQKSAPARYCRSCGKIELNNSKESTKYHSAPLPQYGFEERVDLCARCHMAQGVVEHCGWMEELYSTQQQEQQVMLEARRLVLDKLGPKKRSSTNDINSETDNNNNQKDSDQVENKSKTAEHKNECGSSVDKKDEEGESEDNTIDGDGDDDNDRDSTGRLLPKSHTLQLRPLSHHVMGLIFESPRYVALQRLSPTLRSLCTQFQQGMIGVLEFMELLEAAIGIRDPAMAELKKQAFRVAGDMGTALKLLYEECLPPAVSSGGMNGSLKSSGNHHCRRHMGNNNIVSTELLQSILEFFLDLVVEENELNTLAFFWPQISNIHLQMLPAKDTVSLQKIELLEDFLLTVASKYSIHLTIELVWSHTADLEDALSGIYKDSNTTYCGHRKSAVIRFLCELESLLFDFDTGWGGGAVTVGQYMSPSNHQIELLKCSIGRIQTYRLATEHDQLTRSHRSDKLLQKLMTSSSASDYESINETYNDDTDGIQVSSPEALANEALRIASNADYLTSHLSYTKRLCDIVEKLRFLPVEDRSSTLRTELAKLNASGTMGGDLINVVKNNDRGAKRVVRIPITEGHVFRSKARTPVLLLVETLDDTVDFVKEDRTIGNVVDTAVIITSKDNNAVLNSGGTLNQETAEEIAITENADIVEETLYNANKEAAINGLPSHNNVIQLPLDDNEEKGNISDQDVDEKQTRLSAGEEATKQTSTQSITVADEEESFTLKNETVNPLAEIEEGTVKTNREEHMNESLKAATIGDINSVTIDDNKDHGTKITETIFEDVIMPNLDTTTRSKRLGSLQSTDTSGSLTDNHDEKSCIARHALRRFDSPKSVPKIITPTADRELVESLMTNVVAKQLHLPNLMMKEEVLSSDGDRCQDSDLDSPDQLSLDTEEQNDDQLVKNEVDDNQREPPNLPKHVKMKNLGTGSTGQEQCNGFSKTGETRREVLNAIMNKGMSGSHVIAEKAATGAKRHLQDLERRVAVEALLTGEADIPHGSVRSSDADENRKVLLSLGIRSSTSRDNLELSIPNSEEDEAMEAIRLLLIQYRVANGSISANDAAVVLAPHPKMRSKKNDRGTIMHFGREFPEIDAGDIDARLIGCGVLPPAVLQALTLWKGEVITNGELLELVKRDLEFEKNTQMIGQNTDKLKEDSAFWGRFAFGERWAEKKARIAASSPDAANPGWDLNGIIVKSNDDLRQEAFVMQLIELCNEAFQEAELELWLLPYRIVSTSRSTGIMELIRNSMSFDGLKKRPGYGYGGIRDHLKRMTQYAANPGEAFQSAQRNFARSLAAYSLLSYLFLFKDRHNGNIMLDTAGHVIHIDFGFVLGIAPGGNFSLEMSTPFKLTEEMIEVMDGLRSSLFSEFVTLFCCGFLALQAHCDTFVTLVEITSRGSTFPCFDGKDNAEIINKMQERFCPELNKEESIAHVLDVIKEAIGSYGTKQYDYFQYLTQGIAS